MTAPGAWDEGADPVTRFLDAAQHADDELLDAETQQRLDDLDWATVKLTERGTEILDLTRQRDSARRWAVYLENEVARLSDGRWRDKAVACAVMAVVAWVGFLLLLARVAGVL